MRWPALAARTSTRGTSLRYDAKEDASARGEVDLLVNLGLDQDSVLVDVGAGTGQLALAASRRCARVIAVDVSPVMLDALGIHVRDHGVTNVEIVQAGFLTYEHEGGRADFVYSRYALHHLPDFWKAVALARIHRILRPGGVLRLWDVVYGFDPADAEASVERVVLDRRRRTSRRDGLGPSWRSTCATSRRPTRGSWSR